MLATDIERYVRLPCDFGDIVYHRARTERVPGVVVGFVFFPGITRMIVRWANDLNQEEHCEQELSSEYEPPFI